MTRSDDHRLADIRDAAAKLATRIGTDYEAWAADEDLRLITERLVEIIGEAARAMTCEGRSRYPGVDWTGLIGLRNVLVHAYHRIQPDLLWQVASAEVPTIISALDRRTGGGYQ
ncbi:MAG: hypothetical protein DLM61_20990 [Pseudonocardiales bacterium]|nr:MAG: hypothetical protein DLM61_20990 [Pseudonocardiales bacterium]